MPNKNRLAEMQDEIAGWRRDFHENPELMYDTHRTARAVAAKLREFGCDEVVEGIGRTGVVGVIKGRNDRAGARGRPARRHGRAADHGGDGLPYASKTPGKMHACGHDGHTAMLLGAAKYLAETRNFDGTVAVIFQPAEEGGAGGAGDGRGRPDRSLPHPRRSTACTTRRACRSAQFAIKPGPFYASTDQFTIDVTGQGGHAAKPHVTIDPTVIARHHRPGAADDRRAQRAIRCSRSSFR